MNIQFVLFFFFQAEDGIRDLVRSRGLGDVYKRQDQGVVDRADRDPTAGRRLPGRSRSAPVAGEDLSLSLIHI